MNKIDIFKLASLDKASGILAILLLLCLFSLPYAFFNFVRFIAMIVFACFSFNFFQNKRTAIGVFLGSAALLFQPFFKIYLGKELWNIIDVIMAGIILFMLWKKLK